MTLEVSEADFQQQVIELARIAGYAVAHFRGVAVHRANGSVYYQTPVQADGAGFPDLVLAKSDRLIFAELKAEGGQLSPEQYNWLSTLQSSGAEAYLWGPEDFDQIIKS